MASSKRAPYPWLLALFVLVADQASKALTVAFLPLMSRNALWYPYGGIPVFQDLFGIEFSIVYATNRGAAWGLFSDHQEILLGVRILLIAGVIAYALFFNKQSRWGLPLALIIGGALSNVLDYFIYGHVVDMFRFVLWDYDYPVFNVADSAICLGIFWILALSFVTEKKGKKKKR